MRAILYVACIAAVIVAATAFECGPGYRIVIGSNFTECIECSAGTFSTSLNASDCINCPVAEYQDREGQNACKKCPANTVTVTEGAKIITDCYCDEGYYGTQGTACTRCPTGGECAGRNIVPVPLPGYWSGPEDPLAFYECTPKEACLGGAGSLCEEHYTGRLCGECVSGAQRVELTCRSCPPQPLAIAAGAAVFYIIIAGFFIWAAKHPLYGSFYVFLNFVQIMAVFPRLAAEFHWSVKLLLNLFSVFNFNTELFSMQCIMDSYTFSSRWTIALAIPIAFVALILIHYMFVVCKTEKDSEDRLYSKWEHRQAVIIMLGCVYTSLVLISTEVFDCTKQPNGKYTLDASPSFECYSAEYFNILPMAIAPILVYVFGIPFYFFAQIRKHRDILDHEKFATKYGWIYVRFRFKYWFWESLIMVRKIITVGALVMFSKYLLGHLVPMYATLISMVLTMRYRPYKRREADKAEAQLLLVQFSIQLLLLLSQFKDTTLYGDSDFSILVISWCLFAYGIGASVYYMVQEHIHISTGAPQEEYTTTREAEFPVFVQTVNPAQFSALDKQNQGQPLDPYDDSDSEESEGESSDKQNGAAQV